MFSLKQTLLYIFLFLILFGVFFCGSLSLGPITLRNLSGLLLLFVALFLNRKKFVGDKTCSVFASYLSVCVLVNVFNGCIFTTPFIRMMLVYQLPGAILLYALPKMLKSIEEIKVVFYIIIILYLINTIITYGEFIGNDFCWSIANVVGLEIREEVEDGNFDFFLPGLTGNVVNNGYFVATLLPICLLGLWTKSRIKKMLSYVLFAWSACSVFIIQQRMAVLSLVIFLILYIYQTKNKKLLCGAILIVSYLVYNEDVISSIDMGRLTMETENDDRVGLFEEFNNFLWSSDVFLGGSDIYYQKYGGIQHNAFTSSIVIGGIPVFISFLHLCVTFLKSLYSHYKYSVKTGIILYVPLCLGCIIYFIYSMTHSEGIQSGAVLFWCLYGLIVALDNCHKNTKYVHEDSLCKY